jgi:FtsP/CotA-like multicopper oxidase with cupredoxin domain
VGGYAVVTENYNGAYLSPVVEALPGDTVAAHLENLLDPRATNNSHTMAHGTAGENPTNLHYFHGGIVSPQNARPPIDASQGTGDNVYVRLTNGRDAAGNPSSFNFHVPIPGEKKLDARVLEGEGFISHPNGLNWYHSHMHGISSTQVLGGLSGLLSVGDSKANVRAACKKTALVSSRCDNDVEKDTVALKNRTDVRYVLLRDIRLASASAPPDGANGAKADWVPLERDYHLQDCPVWQNVNGQRIPNSQDPKLRRGFCQPSGDQSAWLFTLNGQRFPAITAEGGRNLLLRIGNLSANVAYWLELCNESTGQTVPLNVVSLDGVVPARPVDPEQAKIPATALHVDDLLLMPASRVELYVRNDTEPLHSETQVLVLRTKGINAVKDKWPEIQLARIVLNPTATTSDIALGLNAPIAQAPSLAFAMWDALRRSLSETFRAEPTPPDGCVRDLRAGEHRRVTFLEADPNPEAPDVEWAIGTEIVHSKEGVGAGPFDELSFEPDANETVGTYDHGALRGIPFEDYVKKGSSVDWLKKHVCIHLNHNESHQQLWVLQNATSGLHNFHIHQMKFRLATRKELVEKYHVKPPGRSHTCQEGCDACQKCKWGEPDFKFYEEDPKPGDPESQPVWHDTYPVPPSGPGVFLVMSYDAKEQVGRFVFHCHILKHEDHGLMAPVEVWE